MMFKSGSHPFLPVLGVAAAMIGLGIASRSGTRRRITASPPEQTRRSALAAYLREHLSASDAAIQTVERLRRTHAGTDEGRLFGTLFEEFQQERDVVRALLARLGASALSIKRLASQASGAVVKMTAGGERGELALLRTLEGLAVGVQGKRCMWRALQSLGPGVTAPGRRSFADLESLAVHQWEAIEERRRSLVRETFASARLSRSAG